VTLFTEKPPTGPPVIAGLAGVNDQLPRWSCATLRCRPGRNQCRLPVPRYPHQSSAVKSLRTRYAGRSEYGVSWGNLTPTNQVSLSQVGTGYGFSIMIKLLADSEPGFAVNGKLFPGQQLAVRSATDRRPLKPDVLHYPPVALSFN